MATEERLEFQQVVEGLYLQALGGRVTPALREALRQAGLDLDRPLAPAYPSQQYFGWLRLTARHLYPQLDEAEGCRQLGRDVIRGWQRTLVGRAASALLVLLGPRRALGRVTRTFRSGDNYTEVELHEVGPGCVELEFNEVHETPTYNQGILEQTGEMIGAPACSVTILSCDGHRCRYRIQWRE